MTSILGRPARGKQLAPTDDKRNFMQDEHDFGEGEKWHGRFSGKCLERWTDGSEPFILSASS